MDYKLAIREIRLERGMTQAELARKAKVKQSYISQLENNSNTKSPTLRVLFKIAEALNVCPHILIRYDANCNEDCFKNCKQKFF